MLSSHAHAIARATNWLQHSGIQERNGGVARYYRSDLERNHPISTEITGYHAGTLAWLGDKEGAALAADFLVDCAWDRALRMFPFEYPHPSPAYFFDSGIIVRGLQAAYRITRKPRYAEVARDCAVQMAKDFDAGFDFHPILELPGKTATVRDPRWSRSSGCYQLKAALPLQEFAPAAWERLLAQSLDRHDQFLPGNDDPERVMDRLHAYCYFLEALLVAHRKEGVALGVQRVAYLLHTIAPQFVRSDVYAQLLRVRIYADAAGILPLDRHTAALEAEALARFQLRSDDRRIDGGFSFGKKGERMLPHVNPVSTSFAIQAISLWHKVEMREPLPSVVELI